jgi:hypothetical protein
MKKKTVRPLLGKSHLPLILLGATLTVYGIVTALVGGRFSNLAMRGVITAGEYRARLEAFDQIAGLIAGIFFFICFVWCAVYSKGIVRVAFSIGAVAAFAPVLSGRAERLLFEVIGLPTMNAGSVLAGALTTILFALPMTILFVLLACGGKVPRGCRWFSLPAILVVLGTAFFPIYVTVLAFLIKPGDPVVGRMIEISSQVMKLRFLLPGVCFLCLAFISTRYARTHPLSVS